MSNNGDVSLGVWVGLFMTMTELMIIREFLQAVLEDREQDFWKIEMANQSFDSILTYVKGLGRDLKSFDRVFEKNNGWFEGFSLAPRLRRAEHLKLRISFQDRVVFGIKGKVNAQAFRVKVQPTNPNSAQLKGFIIRIFFDAPEEARLNARIYNKWFAQNLETILESSDVRSSYIHEFTHVLDFRRMDPRYLLKRTNDKQKDLDTLQTTGGKRDFVKYTNDPLELNAYFSQAMSDVRAMLKTATTPEQKQQVIGGSPQEFVDLFMNKYLKKQLRKNLTPENRQRLMKRAATAWELLNRQ